MRAAKDNPQYDAYAPSDFMLSAVKEENFHITLQDMREVKEIYKTQCPVIWTSASKTSGDDAVFMQALAIQKKLGFDYFMHLVDDYLLDRIAHIEEKGD